METVDIKIVSKDGSVSETVGAIPLGDGKFRLINNPVMSCRINYGTVVAVNEVDGDLVMTKVLRASGFNTRKFSLSAGLTESELRSRIGDKVVAAGGEWEVVFGSIAFVHLPKDSSLDLDALLEEADYLPNEIFDEED